MVAFTVDKVAEPRDRSPSRKLTFPVGVPEFPVTVMVSMSNRLAGFRVKNTVRGAWPLRFDIRFDADG